MDDRLLRDIGLNRGDIERVVGGFDGRKLRMNPLAPTAIAVGRSPRLTERPRDYVADRRPRFRILYARPRRTKETTDPIGRTRTNDDL